MSLTKDKLVFDSADLASSDDLVARLYDSADNALTSTLVSGDQALDVNLVQSVSLDVSSTDLDIRDLSASQDNVAISDGTDTLGVNADGSLNVQITALNLNSEYDEDSPHTSGDKGSFILAVANHTESALHSADGDYAALQVDDLGRLRTVGDLDLSSLVADDAPSTENPLLVGSYAQDGALSAISASGDKAHLLADMYRRVFINDAPNVGVANSAATVTTTAAELASSPLAGRRRIIIQNLGSRAIYVGSSGAVTTSNGLRIARGATLELPWGEDIDVFAIAPTGSQDVRIFEVA